MSNEAEIREFLTSRRAKVTPEVAGLPVYGRKRRVAGLRREEVALLAETSVEYYARSGARQCTWCLARGFGGGRRRASTG